MTGTARGDEAALAPMFQIRNTIADERGWRAGGACVPAPLSTAVALLGRAATVIDEPATV
eukprot:CAMPEP_0119363814 /NCGR_PEP_ID=MMETSP1334-20130426/10735_1 /TAXON_ID=127549 /ORGANISM="Calcidiscus leptoporus, Strain RCC1130" /LENGTH=59 /DNA_ID=CAMNT_0007379361 /DNA_START=161 /DNA_END=337 /DNA_ORIENTATION=-